MSSTREGGFSRVRIRVGVAATHLAANLLVAPEIDPLNFQFSEDTWVDFKLFGLLGLTVIFVVAQAFYLARYMPSASEETK